MVSAVEERFLDRQEERKALGKMGELKYKGDIESYLIDMETLNFKVSLVGTPWRTLLRDRHSDDLNYRLLTTKWEPQNVINNMESVQHVGQANEELLMVEKM